MQTFIPLTVLLSFLLLQACDSQAAQQPNSSSTTLAMNLDHYQWKNRLLLIFAPAETSADYQSQQQFLKSQQSEMSDRNLLLISVFQERGLVGQPTDLNAVAQLRKRFNVKSDEFCIVLVGKDGTEKRREISPTPMSKIYSQIDQMPMRRQEMNDRSN